MNHRTAYLRAPVWVFAFILLAPLARGSVTGSISGTVSDASGAVVPGADVAALNTETGIKQATRTNAQGFYAFPVLPVGHYDVTVQSRGFKEYRQTDLMINVNSALRVDVTLQVGTVTQEVSVSGTSVHVETTSTQMGEVIGTSRMMDMPLNGRSYTDLLALQPGVVPVTSGSYSSYSVSGNLNPGNLSISGQRESANGFMVNGGYAQEAASMGTAIIPNLDSIAEFRILTNSADAEYGNYSGGLVNAITKSGTNRYHGDAFDYLRNSDMDSRNFFSPSRGTLHQNEFGATAGGPIVRDKVFFFTDYQGQRQIVGVDSGLVPVPSVDDKSGNLADVASRLTGPTVNGVYNGPVVTGGYWANLLSQELGYPVSVGEPYYTSTCANSANCVFPNAQIPQSAFSAPAKNLLQYIPAPNLGSNFTTSAYPSTLRDDKGSGRIDANTHLGMLSGYYFIDDYSLVNPYGGAPVPGFSSSTNGRAMTMNLGLTKSFGSNMVNEARINYLRDVNFVGVPKGGCGVSLSSLGFVLGSGTGSAYNGGIVPVGPQCVPGIYFSSFGIGAVGWGSIQLNNTYQVLDNFSKVFGTHTMKFGGSAHLDQLKYSWQGTGVSTGDFGFSGGETGLDFTDFLLGAPSFYELTSLLPVHTQAYYYNLYVQDSWRAKPELTINYGLRWEVSSPWYEVFGQEETQVYGEQSKLFPGSPTGWVFPGDPGLPKTISPVRYDNFAPRVGLAYSPKTTHGFWGKVFGGPGKTSIRASVGRFIAAYEDRYTFQIQGDAPFGNSFENPVPPLFATPYIDRQTGHSEGVHFPVNYPPLNVSQANPDNNVNWAQYFPIFAPGWDKGNGVPYAEHYSLSLQRQAGTSNVVSLSYVGTQAHRLLGDWETNPGNPALCLSVSQPNEVVAGTGTCGPFGENGTFYPITGGAINSTRGPFGPHFGSTALFSTRANSNYNAFEASVRHTTGRLELLAGYTFSKSLDNSSSWGNNGSPYGGDMINFINPKLSKALSSFDMTHIFVMSYGYRLPFEKLWRPNRLTSGWKLSGITRFSTGLPVTLQEYDDNSLLGTFGAGGVGVLDEPNWTPGPLNYANPRSGQPFFNTALFSDEALGTIGTASKRFFHGPGLNNWDMALLKDLRLTESTKLEFRGEFFNIFNHAQFALPQGEILNSAFGYVTSANAARIGQVSLKLLF